MPLNACNGGKTGSAYRIRVAGLALLMAEHVKVIINNPFWYLCDMAPGCLCSYRSFGDMPKYVIVPSIGGGVVLDIWSEDSNEEKQTITFKPVAEGNAIKEAMAFAERYEAAHSKS